MLNIDKKRCLGCGLCAGFSPDNFQMDLDGKAEVVKDEINDRVKAAAANCPAEAIGLEENS